MNSCVLILRPVPASGLSLFTGPQTVKRVNQKFFDVIVNWTLDQKRSIVMGVFNCDFLSLFGSAHHLRRAAVALSEFLLEADLHCVVNSATRGDRCLDVVLSNDLAMVSGVTVVENFSTSDHAVI